MQRRRVGRTDIHLSVVGFGTAQLRRVPEAQALAALRRAFELGVDWVHTGPDYDGAEVLVARALRESGRRDVRVLSNAAGTLAHFGWCFENTCRLLGTRRLELFGISGIDYCEEQGQNVWGPGGMVEFLQARRAEGRLGGLFCTTHAGPDAVERYLRSGVFDALMLGWNPLGFHVLSYHGASEGKVFEDLAATRARIFPLARELGVGLLVMKPLGGGLLVRSRAFPPHERFSDGAPLPAADVLRHILAEPGITAVVPGTASPEEAEENAAAGRAPQLPSARHAQVEAEATRLRLQLCSRCGACEPTCSRGLPVSWLFREAYIWSYPGDTFEALTRRHYFGLHPDTTLACATCTERTCLCPAGLDVPSALTRAHARMLDLRERGLLHATAEELAAGTLRGAHAVRIVARELPARLRPGRPALVRLWLENAGAEPWFSFETQPRAARSVALVARLDGAPEQRRPLLHDVGPEQRTHVVLELQAPPRPGRAALRVSLATLERDGSLGVETPLLEHALEVEAVAPAGREG